MKVCKTKYYKNTIDKYIIKLCDDNSGCYFGICNRIKKQNALLFLVPFCVLIPISVRIAYYRDSMAKISAYMNVFLEEKIEGFDWETRNVLLDEKNMNKKYDFFRNTECLFIGVVCTGLYFYYYIMYKQQICKIIDVALPIIFLFIEIFITFRRKSFVKERKKWISEWQKIRLRLR